MREKDRNPEKKNIHSPSAHKSSWQTWGLLLLKDNDLHLHGYDVNNNMKAKTAFGEV